MTRLHPAALPGRKVIHDLTANIYKGYAKEIFNRFLQYVAKYVSGSAEPDATGWNREALISGYRNKYDLYARWNGRTVIIEFKARLRNIIKEGF